MLAEASPGQLVSSEPTFPMYHGGQHGYCPACQLPKHKLRGKPSNHPFMSPCQLENDGGRNERRLDGWKHNGKEIKLSVTQVNQGIFHSWTYPHIFHPSVLASSPAPQFQNPRCSTGKESTPSCNPCQEQSQGTFSFIFSLKEVTLKMVCMPCTTCLLPLQSVLRF